MRKIICLLAFIGVSGLAHAQAFDSNARALAVKRLISDSVWSLGYIPHVGPMGVHGMGIGACDAKTGLRIPTKTYVPCVVILTSDQNSFDFVKGLYPVGTKIQDVFVVVERGAIAVMR